MKFGTHSYVFLEFWSDDTLHLLDVAAGLGLDVLEIGIGDDIHFSPLETRRRAESAGLDLTISPGGIWPLNCDVSSESEEDRRAGLDWHKKQVDLANELGAIAYCGSLYGHTGVVKKRKPSPDELQWSAEALHVLADYGVGKGVAIVLEPMSHFRTHLVNTPGQMMQLLALADHPNLRVLLDTYHLVTEITDYAEGVRAVGDRLWGLHACENNRGIPGGGIVPWGKVFDALHVIGFDGYLGLETYYSGEDFAWSRGMFHNVCPDPEDFVRQGLAFLKTAVETSRNAGG